MKLTDMKYAREVMERHGIFPKKKFGQNFLTSNFIVDSISDACFESSDIGVIEIGPGIGTLTEALAEKYKKVVCVEIDDALIPVLGETVGWRENVEVVHADALKVDFSELIREKFVGLSVCVCANLPYYITSPIIMRLLECSADFKSITVMIQKEVAERFCAKAGSAEYGAITAVSSYYADAEQLFDVSAGNFYPAPKVTSTVIRFTPHKTPPVEVKDFDNMKKIIEASFGQRRKMLPTALSAATGKHSKAEIAEKISYIGLSPEIRGEKLTLSDFAKLSDILEM